MMVRCILPIGFIRIGLISAACAQGPDVKPDPVFRSEMMIDDLKEELRSEEPKIKERLQSHQSHHRDWPYRLR